MPRIKIEPSQVLQFRSSVESQAGRLEDVGQLLMQTVQDLDMEVAATSHIRQRLQSLQRDARRQADQLSQLSQMLVSASDAFTETDRRLGKASGEAQYLAGLAGAGIAAAAPSVVDLANIQKASWMDRLHEAFGLKTDLLMDGGISLTPEKKAGWLEWIKDRSHAAAEYAADQVENRVEQVTNGAEKLWNGVKNGIHSVGDNLQYCAAWWKDQYHNNENFYRAVETGKSVAAIVTATGVMCVAWLGTVASGGAGAPAAVLTSIYGFNTVASEAHDLGNLITGNYDKVGKVNCLKDTLTESGGETFEMFGGDREAGEKFGEAVYNVGSVVNCVADVSDITTQMSKAPELAKGVQQINHMAVHAPISSIPKGLSDMKKMGIPVGEAIKSAYKLDKSVMDGVLNSGQMIYDLNDTKAIHTAVPAQ